VSDAARLQAFVLAETELIAPPLVPELRLHLARNAYAIFEAAYAMDSDGLRPYWAFAWPGGQALARHILDHPELVRGLRVLDLGAGSALGAIAALKAGAQSATAADIDPLAVAAAELNAAANGVTLQVTTNDLLGAETDYDLILIGDLVYEPDLKDRVGGFLDRHHRRGVPMLYGDRTTARRPPGNFRLLAEHDAPLTPELDEDFVERARVWEL
jgi:predicted nicotinamide N-methyase